MAKIVFFATSWGSHHGGLSAYNYRLCTSIREILSSSDSLYCATPSATDGETLVEGDYAAGILREEHVRRIGDVAWWIGHDIHSGLAAVEAKNLSHGGQTAIFLHSDPQSYEHLKGREPSAIAAKRALQRRILKSADLVFAVGPRLCRRAGDLLREARHTAKVIDLTPGLLPRDEPTRPSTFRAHIHGRLDGDIALLKQAELGAAAFGNCVKNWPDEFGADPSLHVLGTDRVDDFVATATKYADRAIAVHPLPFTVEDGVVADHLRSSSVALMLSIHEGFGLSAWDAIECGIPLVLSTNTGVYELIRDCLGGAGLGCIEAVDVKGPVDPADTVNEKDVESVAVAIFKVARKGPRAFADAKNLRDQLLASGFDWGKRVRFFVRELGLDAREPVAEESNRREESGALVKSPPSVTSVQPSTGALLAEALKDNRATGWLRVAEALASSGSSSDASKVFARAFRLSESDQHKETAMRWAASEASTRALSLHRLEAHLTDAPISEASLRAIASLVALNRATSTASAIDKLLKTMPRNLVLQADRHTREILDGELYARINPGRAIWGALPSAAEHSGEVQRMLSLAAEFLDLVMTSERVRQPTEANWALTQSYVFLEHACLLKRLGQSARSQQVRENAFRNMNLADPVHELLAQAYQKRLSEDCLPLALGAALRVRLFSLEPLDMYKAFRYLDATRSLWPVRRHVLYDWSDAMRSHRDDGKISGYVRAVGRALSGGSSLRAIGSVSLLVEILDQIADRRRSVEAFLQLISSVPDSDMKRSLTSELILRHPEVLDDHPEWIGWNLSDGTRPSSAAFLERFAANAPAELAEKLRIAARRVVVPGKLPTIGATVDEINFMIRTYLNEAIGTSDFESRLRTSWAFWTRVSDSYNTNSHFCLTVVDFVHAVFSAIGSHGCELFDG